MSEFILITATLLVIASILAALMLNTRGGAVPSVHNNVSDKIAND